MDWIYRLLHPVVRDVSRTTLLSCAAAAAAAVFVGLQIFIDFIPDEPDSARALAWVVGAAGVWILYQVGCFILIRAWVYPFLGRWACRSHSASFYDVRIRVIRGEVTMIAKGYEDLATLKQVQAGNITDKPFATIRANGRYSNYVPGELTVAYDLSNTVDVASRYSGFVTFYEVLDQELLHKDKGRHQVMQSEWQVSKGYHENELGKVARLAYGVSYHTRPELSAWLEDFPAMLDSKAAKVVQPTEPAGTARQEFEGTA